MNKCAEAVMAEFTDITVAFGESDEYRYVKHVGVGVLILYSALSYNALQTCFNEDQGL